jgi:hypothetical protein
VSAVSANELAPKLRVDPQSINIASILFASTLTGIAYSRIRSDSRGRAYACTSSQYVVITARPAHLYSCSLAGSQCSHALPQARAGAEVGVNLIQKSLRQHAQRPAPLEDRSTSVTERSGYNRSVWIDSILSFCFPLTLTSDYQADYYANNSIHRSFPPRHICYMPLARTPKGHSWCRVSEISASNDH